MPKSAFHTERESLKKCGLIEPRALSSKSGMRYVPPTAKAGSTTVHNELEKFVESPWWSGPKIRAALEALHEAEMDPYGKGFFL